MSDTEIKLNIDPETAKGVYANLMATNHTQEEFILDFFMMLPPVGNLVSRVVMSPGHLKRTIEVLQQQLQKYEKEHGGVISSKPPADVPTFGYKTNQD